MPVESGTGFKPGMPQSRMIFSKLKPWNIIDLGEGSKTDQPGRLEVIFSQEIQAMARSSIRLAPMPWQAHDRGMHKVMTTAYGP